MQVQRYKNFNLNSKFSGPCVLSPTAPTLLAHVRHCYITVSSRLPHYDSPIMDAGFPASSSLASRSLSHINQPQLFSQFLLVVIIACSSSHEIGIAMALAVNGYQGENVPLAWQVYSSIVRVDLQG
jgi:hypothetical protein